MKQPKAKTTQRVGLRLSQVDKRVRAEALRLAKGDRKRIEVVHRSEVIVRGK